MDLQGQGYDGCGAWQAKHLQQQLLVCLHLDCGSGHWRSNDNREACQGCVRGFD